jgi:AcrR family transcriptional regulator
MKKIRQVKHWSDFMKTPTDSKEKVINAAISLFNTNGFNGTSVRDIADKANVNVAIISYYFKSKKGLLEYLITSFLDQYIQEIENVSLNVKYISAREALVQTIRTIIHFQTSNRHLARFVYREMTLDNVLIRELMATYLAKEKYFLKQLLEKGMKTQEFRKLSVSSVIAQLKGMITMPYLQPQYLTEVLHILPHDDYFYKQFQEEMETWIDLSICQVSNKTRLVIPL